MNNRVNRYSAGSTSALPNFTYLMLCLLVGAALVWDALSMRLVTFVPSAEYWEHTAVLVEWLRNFGAPGNPHVDAASLSPLFMPYFWLLTVVGRTFDFSAEQLLSIGAVANYGLTVVGLNLFLKSYFRNVWAPAVGFVVFFAFWGLAWNIDNVYQLRSLFVVASNPSSFVFALSLLAFWNVQSLLRGALPVAVMAPSLILFIALMLLCDPVTAGFGIVGCVLLIATESAAIRGMTLAALLALVVGVLATELWPYFSMTKLVLGLYDGATTQWFGGADALSPVQRFSTGAWAHPLYDLPMVVPGLGAALLGLPVVLWLCIRREQMFIVLGVVFMALPYVLNLFFEIPSAPRYLLFAVTFLQLAVVWAWLRLIEAWSEIPRAPLARPLLLVSVVVAGLVLAGNVWLATLEFQGSTLNARVLAVTDRSSPVPEGTTVRGVYERLLAPVADGAVILATDTAGWPVPAIKGKIVVLRKPNPLLDDQQARYKDAGDFFFRPISALKRAEIVQRYGADYVLLDLSNPGKYDLLTNWLVENATVVAAEGNFRMLQLLPAVYAVEMPVAEPTPERAQPVAKTPRPAAPSRAAPVTREIVADDEPVVEVEETTRSFGAPIAAPILDPERHGA